MCSYKKRKKILKGGKHYKHACCSLTPDLKVELLLAQQIIFKLEEASEK